MFTFMIWLWSAIGVFVVARAIYKWTHSVWFVTHFAQWISPEAGIYDSQK